MKRLLFVRGLTLCISLFACSPDTTQAPLQEQQETTRELASTRQALVDDSDGDGVPDTADNCPSIANPTQANHNAISSGDACELSLNWSAALLGSSARFQSHKELVIFFAPLILTGRPDLLRVSAPGHQFPHLSPLTQRLGVQSPGEFWPGQADTISDSEVLRVQIGQAPLLGGAKASEVFLTLEGSAAITVTFFDGAADVGFASAAHDGNSMRSFSPGSGVRFDSIELRAQSGRIAIKGPGEGVVFRIGSAQLPFREGYRIVGGVYVDLDECAGLERVCDPLTTCTNLPGSYSCGPCPAGYSGSGSGATGCSDIDECAAQPGPCSPLVPCSNTQGSYQCGACPAGYRGDGHSCVDIDECAEDSDGCDAVVSCTNRPGSYECGPCPTGYSGGGQTGCFDLDECSGAERACDPLVSCSNSQGGFQCGACPAGYAGSGETSCVDVDECAERTAECSPLVTCANTAGGYQCGACPNGYRGDGHNCSDVDECAEQTAQCSGLVACHNNVGSYECGPCPSGYSGDGHSCLDIDECQSAPCDPRTTCSNTTGSYLCGACPPGFSGNGHTGCVDIDECADGSDKCSPLVTCGNTTGGYSCEPCPAGYRGDGFTCTDVDECAEQTHQCDARVSCANTPGGYQCGACPFGYSGDGYAGCVDIDECQTAPCDPLSACSNSPGSYACGACPAGYSGDGYAGCADIDECAVENGGCPQTERCDNTPGSRLCVPCPAGSVGLGTSCGVGACAATGITSCLFGRVQDSCTPGTGALDDATCNRVDDDCDGQVDEEYLSQATSCGVGACAATGVRSCSNGLVVDSCSARAPSAAQDTSCDGRDDDCDGSTDEEYSGACGSGTAQVCVNGQVTGQSSCSDASFCNGTESCNAGRCVRAARSFDDGNPCTLDSCDESAGITHTDRTLGSSCTDGDACNGVELCVPCMESANLLINPSFERTWLPGTHTQGYLPTDWWATTGSPDTYSVDGSWGLAPTDFGNFTDVTSTPDGVRFVAAYSGGQEAIAQELRAPLVPGQRYRLSAKLHQSIHYALPGGYAVSLSPDYLTNRTSRPNDVLLGQLGTTTSSTAWVDVAFEFVAPAAAVDKLLLNFVSYSASAPTAAYPAIDAVKLVRACAASGGLSCQRQDAPQIDDGSPCTVDSCSASTGVVHAAAAQGTACNGSGTCSAAGACSNRPPVITNTPRPYQTVNTGNYTHQVTASDPDGDAISFVKADTSDTRWTLSTSGLVTLVTPVTGIYVLAIQARDSRGAVTTQRRLLQVINGGASPPMVSSQPAQHAVSIGSSFSYQVDVWNPTPGAAVNFTFSAAPPPGMAVSPTGLVSWTPLTSDVGSHEVALQADVNGTLIPHRFVVTVLP